MSTVPLQTRLKELSAALAQIHPLIDRLRRFTASIGQGDEARLELGAEVHTRLKDAEEEMELLRDEVDALESANEGRRKAINSEKEAERERVVSLAGRLDGDLKRFVSCCFDRCGGLHCPQCFGLCANVVTGLEQTSEMPSYKRRRMQKWRSEKRESFCFRAPKRRIRNGPRRS